MATKKSQGVDANEFGNDRNDVAVDERPAPFKTDTSRERNNDDPTASTVGDVAPSQPEDTSATKAEADTASANVRDDSAAVEANAPDQDTGPEPGQPQPMETELPLGLSVEDIVWWNNTSNRNYMPGDGPQAGITEIDGTAQSASSVVPEIRAETLEQSRQDERAARDAQSVATPVEG